jgi:hypothetical protein
MSGSQHYAWVGLKDALAHFAQQATERPQAERERQCGELLLELLKLADRMDVDLFDVCERVIGERARNMPRLVRFPESGQGEG